MTATSTAQTLPTLRAISTPKLRLEVRDATAILTIANPPANTWDRDTLGALPGMLDACAHEHSLRALIITGEGPKFFSAGADLKIFRDNDPAVAREMATLFGRAFERLAYAPFLTIAAINGYAMGGGLECALACDLRIAEPHAQLALPEASVGLLPCGGGTQTLAWTVGEAWAKRMILCGERVSAETALRIGLIEEIIPPGQALARALELAQQAAAQSPSSARACKRLIQEARCMPVAAAWAHEREAFVDLFATDDQKEGVQAFLEKRKPDWKGQ
jgi:enoyl-CoA hydratase/carnithine racemase